MMDPLVVVAKIQKMMRDNLQRVGDAMISGGVDNMEKYQYMLGQIRTYQYLNQEISTLLNKKEQNEQDGTIININSKPKNLVTEQETSRCQTYRKKRRSFNKIT